MKIGAKSNKQAEAKQPGQRGFGCKTNRKSSNPGLKPQMESIVFLVAGWVTVKEMKAPQGLCVRTSIMARCGKIYRMTGRDICWKKKKASCLVISKLNRAEHQHKNSTISR